MTDLSSSDCYCVLLRGIARRITTLYDAALAPVGINVGQFAMLRRVRRSQPVSLTELARLSELDRSTVGRNARVLERMGLLATAPAKDQREAALSVTPEGLRVLTEGGPLWDGAQAQVETVIGPGGREMFRTLLRDL